MLPRCCNWGDISSLAGEVAHKIKKPNQILFRHNFRHTKSFWCKTSSCDSKNQKVTAILLNGGRNRDRTCDIQLVRLALSQLSYSPEFFMAGLTGLEPATSSVTGWHSNRLSYNPAILGYYGTRNYFLLLTASFRVLPGLNLGTTAAGMLIFLPVWGF